MYSYTVALIIHPATVNYRALNNRVVVDRPFPEKRSFAFESSQGLPTCALQVIVMSGQETIRVLEVEVDAPPSQRDKATTLHRETETMDRPLPPPEDPQVEPPWRTVILADRQWNGWKEVDAPVPSSAPDGKSEGNAREEEARLTDQPAVGGTQIGNPMSQSPGKEGKCSAKMSGRHPFRWQLKTNGAFLQGQAHSWWPQKPQSLTSTH